MSKEEQDLIKLDGTIIKTTGEVTKSDFFKFLDVHPDDYSDIYYTKEEARRIKGHLMHLATGASAAIPLICGGVAKCPFKDRCYFVRMDKERKAVNPKAKPLVPLGRQCHPPGEQILTSKNGYVNIEDLDPDIHKLIGYERHHNCVRRGRGGEGYSFQKANRYYSGQLVTLTTESGKSYGSTEDHVCIARFNETAVGKFCVYLMRKGSFWRVGKSQLLGRYQKDNRFGHKTFLAFSNRGRQEKADAMWILGIYDTNTEAMLNEDYFSCWLQTSKTLFQETADDTSKKKWNGLYAWATQDQLDAHHSRLQKPMQFYRDKLAQIGLSVDYPIWTYDNNIKKMEENSTGTKIRARHGMYINACNILPRVMDLPVYPDESQFGKWESVDIEKSFYIGIVYSLNVERYHAYFVNGIGTHNCLIEINLMTEWTKLYIQQYEIDPDNFTDFQMVRDLAECELMLWRLNNNIAKPENAELIQEQVVGIDKSGNTLTRNEVSPFLEAKERLQNRKYKTIKLMVGDRQEQYKRDAALNKRAQEDPSSSSASLRSKMDALMREVKRLDIKTKEATGNVIDADCLPIESEPVQATLSPEDILEEE